MTRWLQYHGLALAILLIGVALFVGTAWHRPLAVAGIPLGVVGVCRLVEAEQAYRESLRGKE